VFARIVALGAVLALAGAGAPVQTAPPQPTAPQPPEAGRTQPAALSPRNASYTIGVRLDHARRELKGREVIRWRNTASIPASSLRFHLYYNAWRNSGSSWMRERQLSGETASTIADADWGWIDIESVALLPPAQGPIDLTSRLRFIAPDDGNPEDRTVAEVPIDTPVAPGDTIDIQVAWTSRVPRTFARTGVIGSYYFVAQWFPKIGVLEDTGWNCHQFHFGTEFFADFGTYDVSLSLPAGWVVGATGREGAAPGQPDARVVPPPADGMTVHRFYQEDVHDFAWTTSPDYIEHRARFEHATLPPVDMRLLLQPEHAGQEARHFDATRATLKYYGEWFGPYPYGHITIVDPAWQSGAGGMEYPTLFTAGSRWIAPRGVTTPESVTIHEAGHQFWYGIVATNEFEHAWMDEGFTTFSTARTIAQAFERNHWAKRYFGGFIPWVFRDIRLARETQGNRLPGYRAAPEADAQSTPTWRYWPATGGTITYNKTALWLNTLERLLGWETLQRIMSVYFSRSAFTHPKPQDFFAVANEVSGRDLTWFFDQVHRSSNTFDYGIEALRSEPAAVTGYVGEGAQRALAAPSTGRYRTTVVVRRYGEGEFPVDVRVAFANGEESRWRWEGRDRWKLFEIEKPVRAVSAEVDPERVLLLDINRTNNSAALMPKGPAAARKWSLAWLIWLQDHLLTYGLFV
jgi:hypothetical protein